MRWKRKYYRTCALSGAMVAAMVAATLMSSDAAGQRVLVSNPYAGIDWTAVSQYKGNLHTHTTESDGSLSPGDVIDLYHGHDYAVLALTDHDRCTWPWRRFDRSPEALGMTAVAGNELSRHHHVLSLFCEYETEETEINAAIAGVADAGGVAILCHPAMHWEGNYSSASRLRRLLDTDARPEKTPPEAAADYVELFKKHAHLVGTEILNASEPLYRYPLDRHLWDELLIALMPERPVWGMAVDDMHSLDHFGRDYLLFLAADRNVETIRNALVKGKFYFSSGRVPESAAESTMLPPRIESIAHDAEEHLIRVRATEEGRVLDEDAYIWIADGEAVSTGPQFPYQSVRGLGAYVRLEITGQGGMTFTNPFGFDDP